MPLYRRLIVVPNAARDTIQILERLGLACVLVEEMAAHLQGGNPTPKNVRLIIYPSPSYQTSMDVGALLLREDPVHFRYHNLRKQAGIRYYDNTGLVPPGKKNHCAIYYAFIKRPPDFYKPPHILRIEGLPVVGMMKIVLDKITDLLSRYDYKLKTNDLHRGTWPPISILKKFEVILTAYIPNAVPGDAALHPKGRFLMERISTLSPVISSLLQPLFLLYHAQGTTPGYSIDGRDPSPEPAYMDGRDPSPEPMDGRDPSPEPMDESSTPAIEKEIRSSPSTSVMHTQIAATHPSIPSTASSSTIFGKNGKKSATTTNIFASNPTSRTGVVCCIAREIVRILHELNIGCAIFGSLACSLYGNTRLPNDIDVLAFPSSGLTTEAIQNAIFDADRNKFCLENDDVPESMKKILYYRVGKGSVPRGTFCSKKCRVNVYIPDTMHLPTLPISQIVLIKGLPVVPFSVLLMHKLQAWNDHRQRNILDRRGPLDCGKKKIHAKDVQQLLTLREHVDGLKVSQPWNDVELFSVDFHALFERTVKDFCLFYSDYKKDFGLLGFAH